MVFAGIFPVDASEFELLRDAIEKLTLNDASVTVEKKSSSGTWAWIPLRIFRIVAYGCV